MSKSVFLFQSVGNYDKHTLLVDFADAKKAEKIVNEGKGIYVDLGEYEKYKEKAAQIHREYEEQKQRIREAENPLLRHPEVQKYELERIEREYEEKTKQIQAEYELFRKRQIEEARKRAAQATIEVTDQDRLTAEQFKNRAALKLAAAADNDKGRILLEIIEEIKLLTDEQKTALQGEIVDLLTSIEGFSREKMAIIDELQDIRNQELLVLKIAEQLPLTVTTDYNLYKLAKKTFGK